jgi:Na+/H+ antiporter NhaC
MALPDRVYKVTDAPMTWTRAILLGLLVYIVAILLLGQAPSWIIYKFDQEVATLIDWSKKVPGVDKELGLNTTQIKIVRDIVANAVQNNFLIMMLAGAYFWQKSKAKRTGAKTLTDPVKGYMPGK